jgi:hypothetical protein
MVCILIVIWDIIEIALSGDKPAEDRRKSPLVAMAFLVTACLVLLCVVTMLMRFEDLDEVQRLETEVKELTKQNQVVEKQRQEMGEYWNNAQQLTEVWLYRTVPRLDLYKEIHSHIEDSRSDTLLSAMRDANQCLELLESNLPALQVWRNDGSLSQEQKKRFGMALNTLCQEPELVQMLDRLHHVADSPIKQLGDGDAPKSKAPGNATNSFASSAGSFKPPSSFTSNAAELTGSFMAAGSSAMAAGSSAMAKKLQAGTSALTRAVSPRK